MRKGSDGADTRPARTAGRPVASRERILDTAMELFAESGFDGTPTLRIAQAAQIPKGLVFHYFPTKLDVLVAVVAERMSLEGLRSLPIEPVAGDVAKTLVRLASRVQETAHVPAALRRILFREASTHPEVGRRLAQLHTEILQGARRAIDAAMEGSRPAGAGPAQRDAAATAFAATLLHHLNLRQLSGSMVDMTGIATLIARGLQAPAIA
ncbi:MAG: TetR/AcrR family transcriptional regulator [Micromonosporaceae bacterium]